MKKPIEKLKLSKKTISRLTNLQMYSVRGGILPNPTATDASNCCGSNPPPASAGCSAHCATTNNCGGGGGTGQSGYSCNCNSGGLTGLCSGDVTCD